MALSQHQKKVLLMHIAAPYQRQLLVMCSALNKIVKELSFPKKSICNSVFLMLVFNANFKALIIL